MNTGIGRGLAEAFLSRPNHTVIAAVRKLATSLTDFKPAEGSKLLVVRIQNETSADPSIAAQQITEMGITRLDLVIANAGITPTAAYQKVENVDLELLRHVFDVNTFSYLPLFQAMRPLLMAAADGQETQAKLLVLSSNASSMTDMELMARVPAAIYGSSKAALNFLVRRTHFDDPWLTAWIMNPGFVQTNNGNATAKVFGMAEAPHTLEQSVNGLLRSVDGATRTGTSGKFYNFDGTELRF